MEDRDIFNQMADYYDRFRPGYPEEIIRTIVEKAGLTAGSRVLEIGAGSGKATAQFLPYGLELLCVEPGADLAARGQARFAGQRISYAVSRFENCELPSGHFDALLSAQAFHWVEKPRGFELCARCLKPGGWLMPFWNIEIIGDSAEDQAMWSLINAHEAFTAVMTAADYEKRVRRITTELADSGHFHAPEVVQVRCEKTFSADEYFGYAMTGTVFVRSPAENRCACHKALRALETRFGGIRRSFVCELYASQHIG